MPKKNPQSIQVESGGRVVLELNTGGTNPSHVFNDRRRVDERGFLLKPSQAVLCGQDSLYVDESGRRLENFPEDIAEKMEMARDWAASSLFLQSLLGLRRNLFNFGFKLQPVERPDEARLRAFEQWHRRWRVALHRFVLETWEDFLTLDAAVAFWRTGESGLRRAAPRVFSIPPERCRYTDEMGVEKLKVKLGWKRDNLKSTSGSGLSERELKRYTEGPIELSEANGEHFRVLKRARTGWGFGDPRMRSIFRTLAQDESLQVGDNCWAEWHRCAVRQFKIGHEVRNGPKAGQPIHFWNIHRDKAIQGFFEGRRGAMDFTGNFDIEMVFPFPSVDRYGQEKYQSIYERIGHWGGAVGALMMAKQPQPFLLELARAEAEEDRALLGPHCEEVIHEVFAPPVPVEVVWSNRVFQESRLRHELLKFLLQSGPLSQESALREGGYDPAEERARKDQESELASREETKGQVLPIFDPAHGKRPGEEAGRPRGLKDGGPRQASLNGAPANGVHSESE